MSERLAPRPGVDPLFTDDDVVEILEYLADEKLSCTGCGQPLIDSMDPENEWLYKAKPVACHACAAMKRAGKNLSNADGIFTVLTRTP